MRVKIIVYQIPQPFDIIAAFSHGFVNLFFGQRDDFVEIDGNHQLFHSTEHYVKEAFICVGIEYLRIGIGFVSEENCNNGKYKRRTPCAEYGTPVAVAHHFCAYRIYYPVNHEEKYGNYYR
jgi:hypothetical protein